MLKFIIASFIILLSISVNADDISDSIKTQLGSCYDLPAKLKDCQQFSCVKPYPEINGAWYTIIVKGMNANNKCYTLSYAFLNDKVVSEAEHCWYDATTLASAVSKASDWKFATTAFDAAKAENDWLKIRINICKMVVVK